MVPAMMALAICSQSTNLGIMRAASCPTSCASMLPMLPTYPATSISSLPCGVVEAEKRASKTIGCSATVEAKVVWMFSLRRAASPSLATAA
jgi:hypothetical protein